MAIAVVVGSAFEASGALGLALEPIVGPDVLGDHTVFRVTDRPDAYVVFRHGRPHRWLPNHIPYRAIARFLAELDCGALLCTTSAGVLDRSVPLNQPLLVSDVLTLDNRLPDGSTCTMWPSPAPDQAHLVVQDGLVNTALSDQIRASLPSVDMGPGVVFAYSGGPRTKTAAENRMWRSLGSQVNSMTVGPEVILANELGIPCAIVAVGHKYSVPGGPVLASETAVTSSLHNTRAALREVVDAFIHHGEAVPFANQLYRFGS